MLPQDALRKLTFENLSILAVEKPKCRVCPRTESYSFPDHVLLR